MRDLKTRYRTLRALNIPLFKFKDPAAALEIKNVRYAAKCLVLLPNLSLTLAEEKILKGMLAVVAEETAWVVAGLTQNQKNLKQEVLHFAPESLLILEDENTKAFEVLADLNIPFQKTHHPKTLHKNPALKRAAYEDLLRFKEILMENKIL